MPGLRFASVVFLAALPVLAQPCEAPPNVKAAIDAATLAPARPLEERAAAARQVRDQFPADYYAHRFYQEQYVANGCSRNLFRKNTKLCWTLMRTICSTRTGFANSPL